MSNSLIQIGDLCSLSKGKIGIKKAVAGKYPLVVTAEKRLSHNECHFNKPSVIIPLVSSTGHGHASLKRIHYQDGEFAVGNILCVVTPKNEKILNANFLYHYLDVYKEELLVSKMKGMANVTLPMKEIAKIEVPIISIKEQSEWVKLFEKTSKETSKLKNEITQQKTLIKKLRQSILQDAIQGKLTEDWRENNPSAESAKELLKRIKKEKEKLIAEKKIKKQKPLPPISKEEIPFALPKSWEWCRLGEIYESASGGTPLRGEYTFWNGYIYWYKSGELNDGILKKPSKEFITQKGLEKSSATLFPYGTLLIAMYGATAGKLAILNVEATTNQAVCGFYENKNILTKYLFYFLFLNKKKMIDDSWGMSQPNISQTYLKKFAFPFPPLDEQSAIVAKVEKLFAYCDELEDKINQSQCDSDMLMQSVLKEAFEE